MTPPRIPQKWKTKVQDNQFAGLFLAIFIIKSVFLLLDSKPAYFLGDSWSYLDTAIYQHIPPDRSFAYGFLLRRIGVHSHSLAPVIWFQVFLSAVSAWLLGLYLVRFFGVRRWLVIALSLLCAVEPLQLLMERYIMTETVATFLFVIYLGLLLEYVSRGNWLILIAWQAVGILLLSMRLSFLPDVLLNSLLAPVVSPAGREMWSDLLTRPNYISASFKRGSWRVVAAHLTLSILLGQGLLTGYKHFYGYLMNAEPALLYAGGYFLLADFLPIVQPEDYPIATQRKALFTNLKYDLHSRTNRLAERWIEGEICSRIEKLWPNHFAGNQIANTTALNAARRDPEGLSTLAWRTFLDYFNRTEFKKEILADEAWGQVLPSGFVRELRAWFQVHQPSGYEPSLTKAWHQAALPWYWVTLCFLPVSPVLLMLCGPAVRAQIVVCVAAALLFFEGATLSLERPNARYLTTAAWLVIMLTGVAVDRIISLKTPAARLS